MRRPSLALRELFERARVQVAGLSAIIFLATPTAVAADDDSAPPRYSITLSGALGGGPGQYVVGALAGGYRVLPVLVAGLSLESTLLAGSGGDVRCAAEWVRVEPRLELHPVAPSLVSPWVGGELGYGYIRQERESQDGTATTFADHALVGALEGGVDVYPWRHFGAGAFFGYEAALTAETDSADIWQLGLRVAARF